MRKVTVFVHNSDGRGVHGQKVNLYDERHLYTDSGGKVELLVDLDESQRTSVYVNGRTAYSGYVSNMPKVITWEIG